MRDYHNLVDRLERHGIRDKGGSDLIVALLDRLDDARSRALLPNETVGERLDILQLAKDDPHRIAHLAVQRIRDLEREVEQWKGEARGDIRSQLIFSDNKQATEIRFRQLKYQVQAMKRLGKQFGLAMRYLAQGMENTEPERASDMRQLAHVLGEDFWTTEDIQGVKAPELVKTTQAYKNALRISEGKDANL